MIIDTELLDKVSEQAKASPRLRMNYNFHQSLDEKCHRFINAVDPGTEVPIHKHPTKGSLKKCQEKLEVPADVLKKWDLMNNLQKMVDNPKTRVKTRAQFHAKFYAGVFDDHVEMLSGSFNVQTGVVLEQMHLRTVSRELFKTNYLDRLVEGFVYEPSYNPRTLFVNISKDGEVKSKVEWLKRS